VRFPCVHAAATTPAQRLNVSLRSFHPDVSVFPDRVVGSTCALFFSRIARRSLALRPAHSRCHQSCDTLIEGFSHFVTSTAPIASGWSCCRVGFAPTGKRRLCTTHTRSGHLRDPSKMGNLSLVGDPSCCARFPLFRESNAANGHIGRC
jgi:hypothetical protein